MHPQSPWWLGTPLWMCNVFGEFNNRLAGGLFCKRMLLFCTRRRHFLPACQGHPLLLSKRSLVSSRKRWKKLNLIWGQTWRRRKIFTNNGNVGSCFRMSFSSDFLFPCFIIIIFQPWFYYLYTLNLFGLSHLGYYRLSSTCQPSQQKMYFHCQGHQDGRGSQTTIYGIETPECNHPRRKNSSKGKAREVGRRRKDGSRQNSRATIRSNPSPFPEFLVRLTKSIPVRQKLWSVVLWLRY